MLLTNANFIPVVISLWFVFIVGEFYRKLIYPLINEINELKKKQDILYESIQKLKIVIDIDKDTKDKLSTDLKMLKRELFRNEINSETSSEEKDILHIQTHITFPQSTYFEESNYKLTKNKSNCKKLKDDTRVISNQLAKFLNKQLGTCMTFNEAYTRIWDMLGSDSLLFIFGNKLRKLFGIYENEDYEITRENLSNYLEPHF